MIVMENKKDMRKHVSVSLRTRRMTKSGTVETAVCEH